MKPLARLLVTTGMLAASFAFADTVKDREGAVRKDKAAMENDARWAYNDVERGFAEAKRTGKPLLVVLRCVPCTVTDVRAATTDEISHGHIHGEHGHQH